jgi:anti-sigma regulatory factor (Ser/Thr protein kinase)
VWPAHPEQLALMRAQLRGWLASLGLTGETQDDLVLAVNEAASNSVEHAYLSAAGDDTVELTLWTEPHTVCVEVVDHGAWLVPSDRPNGRGRGIEMMQRLMASVQIHCDTRGTRVLLRHPLSGSPAAASHLVNGRP